MRNNVDCFQSGKVSCLVDPVVNTEVGGRNSLRETIIAEVPLFVLPFFGDPKCTTEFIHGHIRCAMISTSWEDHDSSLLDLPHRFLAPSKLKAYLIRPAHQIFLQDANDPWIPITC